MERRFPEQRLFLRTDTETRFLRIGSGMQLSLLVGGGALVLWTVFATATVLIDTLAKDSDRTRIAQQQQQYELRLAQMERERDNRLNEARAAQERFRLALEKVSDQQMALLSAEDRRRELEQATEALQRMLRDTLRERDRARADATAFREELRATTGSTRTEVGRLRDLEDTLDYMVDALSLTADARDSILSEAREQEARIVELEMDLRLVEERTERVFTRLEEAATVSMEPLARMFEQVGLSTDRLLEDVRRAYSGTGGPLSPLSFSTRGEPEDPMTQRANEVLVKLDQVNLYRLAAEGAPFGYPVRAAHRFTSGFGYRRDPKTGGRRLHAGIDLAAAQGTPILATASGVVTHAGWQGGYGRLVTIRHSFGFETRYAHLHTISVRVGQRVSRGDRIGGMGTTGRSTGVHLHYEVHVGGRAVNPMTYIRAARDVF
ncbi:MAG: peptidoglycan DD-metalloendopeptidase family protein [Rhodobacteraceae bacterium]|nr:peptidoglycan DD-metalloendopeptidase family protein [Paracoccaceae bacterium]